MVERKLFSGIMDTDSTEDKISPANHKYAKNMRFFGTEQGLAGQNVKGNVLIENANLPAGDNECCGAFFDPVRKRILWFNYNSEGNHGLYKLNLLSQEVSTIFLCGTDSATDIFRLSLDYPVYSAAIIYRPDSEGDLFYWTDGNAEDNNMPRCLNLDTVQDFAPFTEDMINAAKNAPLAPVLPFYQDNSSRTVNNLRKKLFRFIYRWVYANGEKSTWSPISKVPLPIDADNPVIDNDPTKNNNIRIPVFGGGDDYEAIEIAGQQSEGTVWSDFFMIDRLGRDEYGINPEATYNYDFYNDGAYPYIAVEETDLYFSWLPDIANTLESLNGNVILYGGLTDGQDRILREDVDVSITASLSSINSPTITWTYAGSIATVNVQIGSTVTPGTIYNVSFEYVSGPLQPPISVSYTAQVGDDSSAVASALAALIATPELDVTIISVGLFRMSTATLPGDIFNISMSVSGANSQTSTPAWDWSSPQRFGLVYFDDRGKTNGVVSFVSDDALDTTDFAVNTPDFNTSSNQPLIPLISASISHTPPEWAVSYQWVRAALMPKFLYWITNDYQTDTDFLYFCIQNLTYQKTKNTGFVPSYEYTSGDRLKVVAQYLGGNYTPYNIQLDFEILGTVERTMNTPASPGTFLKVKKPATLPSLAYSAHMLVRAYTPKQTVSDHLQLFYEWGERYSIYEADDGRFHSGQITNQTISQPATFQWFDGDVYFKDRSFYLDVDATTQVEAFMMDANYNDYFSSAVNSNGRGWPIDENAARAYDSVIMRWSNAYQDSTNINGLNIVQADSFTRADRSKGSILRFKARDRSFKIFQARGVGEMGIYSRYIQNNEGQTDLISTDVIITKNNIQYYQGEYGLGDQPGSLVSASFRDYFADPVRGYQVRLSTDGFTPISQLYKGQFYIRGLLTKYNNNYIRANGSRAKILGFYNYVDEEYNCILQGGDLYASTLETVEDGVIQDGDINTPSTMTVEFNGYSTPPTAYTVSFGGTAFAGDVLRITLTSNGANEVTLPMAVQSGWNLTTIATQFASLIDGNANYIATAGTYLGNPSVTITGATGTEVITATFNVTYPVYIATFTGTPAEGDVVRLSTFFSSPSPTVFTYTFPSGGTIASMISSLVSQINAGGVYTAASVTYEGFPGVTTKYLPSTTIGGSTTITKVSSGAIDDYMFSFNEPRNGYTSFYDDHPEWALSADDIIYTWKEGEIYSRTSDTYCNFYGVQYDMDLQVVCNTNKDQKKTWLNISEVCNDVLVCPEMYSNVKSNNTQRQETTLVAGEFEILEGNPSASIKRDANSIGGKINGDIMKGNWLAVTFRKEDAADLINLSEVDIHFIDSPLTNR